MKKVVLLVMVLCFAPLALADEIGVGGIWITGAHSQTNDDSMDNDSWGIDAHYDKDMDWEKQVSPNHVLGIVPGMNYKYLRWTKNHNKKRMKYSPTDWDCVRECPGVPVTATSENYTESEKINTQILAFTLKPFWEIHNWRLFAVGGAGIEVSDSDDGEFAVLFGGGIQYMFTERFGTSLAWNEIYSNPTGEYRRWETAVLSLDFRF